MKIQSVRIDNARLREGNVYQFRILKIVSLGPDDDWFVLEDPQAYKILLPKYFYDGYGLAPGNSINCRVDKVNCNGKVFLEPEHPHYREGEVYSFSVHCKGQRKDILGADEYYFMVTDALNKQWKVRIHSKSLWDDPPKSIKCRLKRIKKGMLYLQYAGDDGKSSGEMKAGKVYPFTIIDEKKDPESGKSFYILQDQKDSKHLLNKKYFAWYGLNKGNRIQCFVEKQAAEGYYILEPAHPCYETGKKYEFPVDRLEEMLFSDGFKQKALVLRDCFGEEVKVNLDDRLVRLLGEKRYIQARIRKIRKSRLELEIIEEQPI
jgi:hypothetical protein